jgi:hypothetical protein
VSHKHARDRVDKQKSYSFARLTHELCRQSIVLSVICPLPSVRVRSRGFPHMGGYYLLKYNGGDSGIKISIHYWRCSLIRVSVIRGFTVSVYAHKHLVFEVQTETCFYARQTIRNRPGTLEIARQYIGRSVHACIDPGGSHFEHLS